MTSAKKKVITLITIYSKMINNLKMSPNLSVWKKNYTKPKLEHA